MLQLTKTLVIKRKIVSASSSCLNRCFHQEIFPVRPTHEEYDEEDTEYCCSLNTRNYMTTTTREMPFVARGEWQKSKLFPSADEFWCCDDTTNTFTTTVGDQQQYK
jgi:hypothetical protein